MFEPSQWLWSIEHRQHCKLVEVSRLRDDATEAERPPRIRYVHNATHIAKLLGEDVLLTPVSTSDIPLRHELKALRRPVSQDVFPASR